jgi:hypothetical protein
MGQKQTQTLPKNVQSGHSWAKRVNNGRKSTNRGMKLGQKGQKMGKKAQKMCQLGQF